MITFRPMTLLAAALRRRALLAAGLLALLAGRAGAQVELTHTEDAAPIPRGMMRLRITTGWTRYDQRYGANGLEPLGAELSSDSLGAAQFPLLTPIQDALKSLAGDSQLRLSLGRLVTQGDARIVTTPIALEYGLTRRLSIGVVVPVVQARRVIGLTVNASGDANVGFVPSTRRDEAAAANKSAADSYNTAATELAGLITSCQANPSDPACATYASDPAGAASARALAAQMAGAAAALGTTSATALVAPRANGAAAQEIQIQRAVLNRQLQRYLGANATQVSAVFFAPTDFSYIDLQGRDGTPGLLQGTIGGGLDSIRTVERLGIGDVSVGVQYLAIDHFQHDSLPVHGTQARLSVGVGFRFATSRADTATNLVDIGTGSGAGVELHSALDMIRGRVGGTVAARYVKSFARNVSAPLYGDPEAPFPLPSLGRRDRTEGDVLALDLTPRYLLSETFAIDLAYGLERHGATTWSAVDTPAADQPTFCAYVSCAAAAGVARTAQRAGLGLRYSTVDSYDRGAARFPFEVSFTHLTTVSGDVGIPKLSRDQIQLRIFYRLFGP